MNAQGVPEQVVTDLLRPLAMKVAVVTGSTSGIGLGIARALAAAGASVVLHGLGDRNEIAATQKAIEDDFGVTTSFSDADMSSPEATVAMITDAMAAHGRLDILVNNAGIQHVAPIDEFPPQKMGCDPSDQSQLGVPHDPHRVADDARAEFRADHQHRIGARARRVAVQERLCRGQARHHRLDQDGRARMRRTADHLQRDLPRLCRDAAGRGANRCAGQGTRHQPRKRHPRRVAGRSSRTSVSPRSRKSAR